MARPYEGTRLGADGKRYADDDPELPTDAAPFSRRTQLAEIEAAADRYPFYEVDYLVIVGPVEDWATLIAAGQPDEEGIDIAVEFQGDDELNGIYWGRTEPGETDPGNFVTWRRVMDLPEQAIIVANHAITGGTGTDWSRSAQGRYVWKRTGPDAGDGEHGTWIVNDD